jgi:hypothetical protein
MLAIGEQILLQLPNPSGEPSLRLGAVLQTEDATCSAEFEGEATWPECGVELFAYFLAAGTFYEQPARVERVSTQGTTTTISVRLIGKRVAAENRMTPRVSTVTTDLIATVDAEECCPIIDISETGFALMASEIHAIGAVVSVTISYNGRAFSGRASVQSSRELWEGRFRYGLHGIDGEAGSDALTVGLRQIALSVSRDGE